MILPLLATALAAPSPDRPAISRSATLIDADSIELEVGGSWRGQGAASTPTTLKLNVVDVIEPRLGFDLSRVRGGPDLQLGSKIKFLSRDSWALAGWVSSGIPTSGEPWRGQAHALIGLQPGSAVTITSNAGVNLDQNGVSAIVTGRIDYDITGRILTFAEVAGLAPVIADGGLGLRLTDQLVLDVGAGYDFTARSPLLALGLTANLGIYR